MPIDMSEKIYYEEHDHEPILSDKYMITIETVTVSANLHMAHGNCCHVPYAYQMYVGLAETWHLTLRRFGTNSNCRACSQAHKQSPQEQVSSGCELELASKLVSMLLSAAPHGAEATWPNYGRDKRDNLHRHFSLAPSAGPAWRKCCAKGPEPKGIRYPDWQS